MDETQSAMLLTDEEWNDLAFIAATYKHEWLARADLGQYTPEGEALVRRRIALADRIIEASRD